MPEWCYLLQDYDLKVLGEYLQFGFSFHVDYGIFQFDTIIDNHAFAVQKPDGVHKYCALEVCKQAMVGPLKEVPFEKLHVPPLMARDKPDGGVRVIVDLSWPLSQITNSCVSPDVYDGIPSTLKYPTVDDIVAQIRTLGPQALLLKVILKGLFKIYESTPIIIHY